MGFKQLLDDVFITENEVGLPDAAGDVAGDVASTSTTVSECGDMSERLCGAMDSAFAIAQGEDIVVPAPNHHMEDLKGHIQKAAAELAVAAPIANDIRRSATDGAQPQLQNIYELIDAVTTMLSGVCSNLAVKLDIRKTEQKDDNAVS